MRKQTAPARLTSNGAVGGTRLTGEGVVAVDAAIRVPNQAAPLCVHGEVVKIEKPSVRRVAALASQADLAFLDRVQRGGVDQDPGLSAVVGMSDVKMPDTREARIGKGSRAWCGGSDKGKRGAIVVPGHHDWESGALHA